VDDIRMDLWEIGWEGVDWMHLAQDMYQWRAVVNMVMNRLDSIKGEEFLDYVYTANTDKDCDLLHDRPVLSMGRTPHDKQNCNCLDYSHHLAVSPEGA
jgi:hypothetical protein